jgi:hypothetical protein
MHPIASRAASCALALALALALSFSSFSAAAQPAPSSPVPAPVPVPVPVPALPSPSPSPSDSPSPSPTPDIPARLDGRALSVCGTEPMDPIARRVRGTVVEVGGSFTGTLGFVFGEPDLVVAPFAVAESGRGVQVTHDGRAMPATIAAIDEEAGLALLRVAGLSGVKPLEPSPHEPALGHAVLGVSQPYGVGGPADQVTGGHVTQGEGHWFRSSALVGFGFAVGSPLVDCRGRVLGMGEWYGDRAVGIHRAQAMVNRVRGGAPPYEGRWSLAHPSFHALLEVDHDGEAWGGADLGLALVGHDRWEFGLSGRLLGRGEPPEQASDAWVTREWGVRGGADLRAGARLMLTEGAMPLYVVPHVGIGFDVSARGGERSRGQIESEGCSSSEPCPVVTELRQLPTVTEARIAPQVGLAFRIGFVDLGYTFRLDVDTPDASSHQVGMGIQF